MRQGEHLGQAAELTVEQFFQIWMANAYPQKVDLNCHKLYQDSSYTYFGKNKLALLHLAPNLYKVRTDSLTLKFGQYQRIDGQMIRAAFREKAIPKADKNIWEDTACANGSSRPRYTYHLQDDKITISLDWKVKCNGKKLLDKTYKGHFDMEKMALIVE